MSLLSELKALMPIPVETGAFTDKAPDEYAVLTPMSDDFELMGDDLPISEVQSVRISLFTKGNYKSLKDRITRLLVNNGITIIERVFIDYEEDTKYYHYSIDVENAYDYQEEENGNNRI